MYDKLTYKMEKRVQKDKPYDTFDFRYTKKEIEELIAVPMFNVNASEKKIIQAIRTFVLRHIEKFKARTVKKKKPAPVRQRLIGRKPLK